MGIINFLNDIKFNPNEVNIDWQSLLIDFGFLIIGYLWGSIAWSIIISRKIHKRDLRKYGSSNAGTTNAFRTFGIKTGIIVMCLDIFVKAWLPMTILLIMLKFIKPFADFLPNPMFLALGIIIGHCFPIFFKFRGGKAAACITGILCAWNPAFFIVAPFLGFSLLFIYRYVALSSIITFPLCLFVIMIGITFDWWPLAYSIYNLDYLSIKSENLEINNILSMFICLFGSFIVIIRHKLNIYKLLHGLEQKFYFSKKGKLVKIKK